MTMSLSATQQAVIRAQFPILAQQMNEEPLIYLDSAATAQTPLTVVEAMQQVYLTQMANVHRGVYQLAQATTDAYESARQTLADFMGAKAHETILTSGTTAGLNFLAERLVKPLLQAGDQIWLTRLEHHANLVPWQVVCEQTGAELCYLPLTASYQIDLAALAQVDVSRAKVIAVHQVSNVLGVEQPIAELAQWAQQHDCMLLVDGAQAVAHLDVDVKALGVDAYCWSGHKLYGPTGVGVCYLAEKWHEQCQPFFYGGEMIHQVGDYHSNYASAPHKFEGGTPPIAEVMGLQQAVKWYQQHEPSRLHRYENELLTQLVDGLQAIDGVTIYGSGNGIVSFNIQGVHPHDAATGYDLEGIALRAGHHCAQPLMRYLEVAATLRASIACYNTSEEIERLIAVTKKVKEFFVDGVNAIE